MGEEAAFLSAIRQTPADETTRLVYADWIDEQGDSAHAMMAQFIRLDLQMLTDEKPDDLNRLQELARGIDPDWLALVSHPVVEACRLRLIRPCPGRWDLLLPTADSRVRSCGTCQRPIRYCDSTAEGWPHVLSGAPTVISPAVARTPNDWGRFVPLPQTPTGVIQHGAALLERKRRSYGQPVVPPPPPAPDEEPRVGPGSKAPPLPRRREGGRTRNRNIQRQDWEEE
jgi:uncharacterized protein (TIGR02996 family)